jgi:hypothetical protein
MSKLTLGNIRVNILHGDYQLCARCNGETHDDDMVEDVCKWCATDTVPSVYGGTEEDWRIIRKANSDAQDEITEILHDLQS